MPRGKQPSQEEKNRWLDLYERGKTFEEIAKDEGRDPSTVRKNVRRAQEERTRSVARGELIRTILERHNQKMFDALGRHRDRISFRPPDQIASAFSHPYEGLSKHDYGFENNLESFELAPWHVEGENGLENELVREHLYSTKAQMWRNYDRWIENHARYLWRVWRLGNKAFPKFRDQSGLQPVEQGERFHSSAIQKLVLAALELAGSGTSKTVCGLKIDRGGMETTGTVILYAESQEKLSRAKKAFESIALKLSQTEDAKEAAKAIPALQEQMVKLRRQFELIRVMGFIEGSCEACRAYVK